MSCAPWIVQNRHMWPCPLSSSNTFHRIVMKLGDNVYGHNISVKFDNQPNPSRHSWVVPLEFSKIDIYGLVRSLVQILFIGSQWYLDIPWILKKYSIQLCLHLHLKIINQNFKTLCKDVSRNTTFINNKAILLMALILTGVFCDGWHSCFQIKLTILLNILPLWLYNNNVSLFFLYTWML